MSKTTKEDFLKELKTLETETKFLKEFLEKKDCDLDSNELTLKIGNLGESYQALLDLDDQVTKDKEIYCDCEHGGLREFEDQHEEIVCGFCIGIDQQQAV